MGISFNNVPSNLRAPAVVAEFNNTHAQQGPSLLNYKALLIGQKTSAGSATANTVVGNITSADQLIALAGRGSQLHRMGKAWFANNGFTALSVGVLADNGSGVAATSTLTVTGPATAAGTLALYIAGTVVNTAVASGDSATTIATNVSAAVNLLTDLPVTAGHSSGVVTFTAKNAGACSNDIDVRLNYQSTDATPAGVTGTVVAMSAGATNPVLTTLITALGDQWFQVIAHPYTDATSLTALEAEMVSRFGPTRQIDGVAITSAAGSQSTLATLGQGRNCPHSAIVAQPGKNPLTPPPEFAAAVAGVVALYGNADPARPFQTLPVAGVVAVATADQFVYVDRNLCLYDGIGTTKQDVSGQVSVDRLVTTYETNAAGAADTSYLDVNTMLTLLYVRYSFANQIKTKYPRHKVANDGTRFGPGQAVITPSIGKAEAILWFRQMEALGLVEDFDQFKRDLVVERDGSDPSRINWLLPPNLVNGFIIGAISIQFRL